MKFLFDLFPVLLFFGVFKWGESHPDTALSLANQLMSGVISGGAVHGTLAPVLLATAIAIISTALQIGYLLVRRQKVDGMLWLSLAIISVFGGATIYFQNDTFVKWKPTIFYWCSAAALLISALVFKKNLVRSMMEKQMVLPEPLWPRLNLVWIAFLVTMGLVNLYVAFNFSFSTWASFKLFGATALMFAFIVGQTLYLSKYIKEPE
jgi:intracellular septation protein